MDIAGTPYYIAPEVLTGKYGAACDIWSLGVCLYQMLTGMMPFDGTSQEQVFGKIKLGIFKMPKHLSEQAQDLIRKMIEVNPDKRITAKTAMEHPWIKEVDACAHDENEIVLSQEIVTNLKNYRGESLLKKAAMNVLVKHLNLAQIEGLKKEFEKIDIDCSGFLEVSELEQAIANANVEGITGKEISSIIKEIDYADNKKVNYSEFLAATINANTFLNEHKIMAIFKSFDTDNTGEITADNLKVAFSKFGREVNNEQIKEIIDKHDLDGGKTITIDEFTQMLLGKDFV